MTIYATRGPDLLIIADSPEAAARELNDYSGISSFDCLPYRYDSGDIEQIGCTVPTSEIARPAPGYPPHVYTLLQNARASGRLFITRGF